MREIVTLSFTVGYSYALEEEPGEMVEAVVPGAVQLDWARAHGYLPHYYAENWTQYRWMEDVFWHYRAPLQVPLAEGERLLLCGKGIDYRYRIRVNDRVLYEYEGMYKPFSLDLTDALSGMDTLYIDIFPVPKRPGRPDDRSQASLCCKPPVSYGWDWHPRLIPSGIWEDIWLEKHREPYIADAAFTYELDDACEEAQFACEVEINRPGETDGAQPLEVHMQIAGSDGAPVYDTMAVAGEFRLAFRDRLVHPELWWPSGSGPQAMYTVRVELMSGRRVLDVWERRCGFRKTELVVYEGGWEEPRQMPKSRSDPPATLLINGRRVFCKGSNWVLPDIFYGTLDEAVYRGQLQLAKDAHFNMLRVWGGGIVNKEPFYELCDELGILIWQEFPLACNNYENDKGYMAVLDSESRAIIRRLRQHACLAIWCGGNELFNAWSGMTEQSHALRLLDRNCFEEDRQTPFIMTSPLSGMAHGGYFFREADGREIYEIIGSSRNTAYTEFGCSSISDLEILKLALPRDEIFPPSPDSSWTSHHGFGALAGRGWAVPETIAHYFGESPDIETLIQRSQLLQAEGYKMVFEEARRQQPRCSMAINWCYNEPWPTAAGNNLISWTGRPKPAYEAVKQALRSTLASARPVRFLWNEGEDFEAELWLLNDAAEEVEAGVVTAYLDIGGVRTDVLRWDAGRVSAGANRRGPTYRVRLPHAAAGVMELVLAAARPGLESVYRFAYRPRPQAAQRPGPAGMNYMNY